MADAAQRVFVVGAGAIGAFYGGVLARAGCEVSVLARTDHDAVAASGYRIDSGLGDLSFRPAQVVRDASHFDGPAEYLLVCLKLVAGIDVAALIQPALRPHTTIIFVANGIDVEAPLAAAFPDHELVSGVAYATVSRAAPGHVKHHSQYTRLVLGRYPGGASPAAESFVELLKRGGSNGVVSEDIVGARWLKCTWNAVFNPISVLGQGMGTRDILADETTARFVCDIIAETCAIAAACGHPLPADTAATQIAGTLRIPNFVSSMGQDYLAGRPMETEALLGNAVRIARRLGVAIPRLEALYALIRMIETRSAVR